MFLADNIGDDGKVYPTVGEHIRNTSKTAPEKFIKGIKNNTDIAKITTKLDVSANELRSFIIAILSGKTGYFGGLDADKLTEEELKQIKTFIGTSS